MTVITDARDHEGTAPLRRLSTGRATASLDAAQLRGDAAQALVSVDLLSAGRLVFVSAAFAALLGATAAELDGRDLADFLRRGDPDDDGGLAQVLDGRQARATGRRQLITAEGDVVVCAFTAARTQGRPDGRALALVSVVPLSAGTTREHERVRAADEALAGAPYGVAIFDAYGRCVQANPAWVVLAGTGADLGAAQPFAGVRDPGGAARAAAAAATSGVRQDLTLGGRHPDGTPFALRLVLTPRAAAGGTTGFVAYAHEVPVAAPPGSGTEDGDADADADTVGPGVAARVLGVSHSTLRRWIEDGQLHATRTAGGHRRIRRAELRRVASAVARPGRVRVAELPDRPLPVLGAVLNHEGAALVRAAAQATYVPGRPGWFAEREAAAALQAWGWTSAQAIAAGSAPAAVVATRALFEAARDAAGLEECVTFADRFSALALRRLQAEPGGPAELSDARTLLAAMRRSLLTLEDDRDRSR